MSRRTTCVVLLCSLALVPRPFFAAQLSAKTTSTFDEYIRVKEARDARELAAHEHFLFIDVLPQMQKNATYADLKQGPILVQRDNECASPDCASISGGLIHDWIGLIFVPGVSLPQVLATLQDYSRDAQYYSPEVVQSRLLAKSGGDFRIFLRLKRVQVITVVLDTEYDIHYTQLDRDHAYAISHSTRVAEVENADLPGERDKPVGNDHGFLWQLDSYWRFYQADGGVYIQCEAVSLTRDVPTGLGWLIRSFIEKIPAESLRSTLAETRAALLEKLNHP